MSETQNHNVTITFEDSNHTHTMTSKEYTAMILLAQVGAGAAIFGTLVAIEKVTPHIEKKLSDLKSKFRK